MFLLKDDFLILKKIISTDKIVLLIPKARSKTNVTEKNISKYRWQNVFRWPISVILIWPSIFSIASRFCHLWITLVISWIEMENIDEVTGKCSVVKQWKLLSIDPVVCLYFYESNLNTTFHQQSMYLMNYSFSREQTHIFIYVSNKWNNWLTVKGG